VEDLDAILADKSPQDPHVMREVNWAKALREANIVKDGNPGLIAPLNKYARGGRGYRDVNPHFKQFPTEEKDPRRLTAPAEMKVGVKDPHVIFLQIVFAKRSGCPGVFQIDPPGSRNLDRNG